MREHRTTSHTSPEARATMVEIYSKMPSWRKVELVEDANRTARQLAMTGLRSRHPGESKDRLRRRLLGLVLGEDLAREIYGPLDEAEQVVQTIVEVDTGS